MVGQVILWSFIGMVFVGQQTEQNHLKKRQGDSKMEKMNSAKNFNNECKFEFAAKNAN